MHRKGEKRKRKYKGMELDRYASTGVPQLSRYPWIKRFVDVFLIRAGKGRWSVFLIALFSWGLRDGADPRPG